jgi:hypothetical protein
MYSGAKPETLNFNLLRKNDLSPILTSFAMVKYLEGGNYGH